MTQNSEIITLRQFTPNLSSAIELLELYDEDLLCTFQLFKDSPACTSFPSFFTGRLSDPAVQARLATANNSGQGVFFMVNGGNGKGRDADSVTSIRALVADLDGAPIGPVLSCELEPTIIIESSPGKYQAHWLIEPIALDEQNKKQWAQKFKALQISLAHKFNADASVNDISRVFRVPGYLHQKKEPFQTKVFERFRFKPYKLDAVISRLGLSESAPKESQDKITLKDCTPSQRHEFLMRHGARSIALGFTPEESHVYVSALNQKYCKPPIDRPGEIESIISSAFQKYKKELPKAEAPRTIEVTDAATYLSSEPPAFTPIIEGLVDVGDKAVIIGKSKTKKSFFTQQLALCLATGRAFLGLPTITPKKVLIVQFEIRAGRYHARVKKMAEAMGIQDQELSDRLHVLNARGLKVDFEAIQNTVALHKPEVVVIDPLYKLIEGDENKSEDIKKVLAFFDSLTENNNVAVLYVHHDKKGHTGEIEATDRGSGSGVLGRDYDAGILLSAHALSDDALVVEFRSRNHPPMEDLSIDWYGYAFIPSPLAAQKQSANAAKAGKRDSSSDILEKGKSAVRDASSRGVDEMTSGPFGLLLVDFGIKRDDVVSVRDMLVEIGFVSVEKRKAKRGQSCVMVTLHPQSDVSVTDGEYVLTQDRDDPLF